MKCPKCGYLGFEHVDRCRNCGYEFSLSAAIDLPELALRTDTRTMTPLDDLAMLDHIVPLSNRYEPPVFELPVQDAPPEKTARAKLPLFGPDDLEPLITRPSPPRQPLAVRRATPEIPRLRSEQPRGQALDLDLGSASSLTAPMRPMDMGDAARRAQWPPFVETGQPAEAAGLGARLVAGVIDLLTLISVDVIVIYFTMQICALSIGDLGILPKAPLLAFLLVQNGGYLAVFTTSGQTLGKMAAGIKVVAADSGLSVDLGHAVVRTLVWLVLAAPAGLGFVTTLLSRDHRGLHDRVAGTRVVRVG